MTTIMFRDDDDDDEFDPNPAILSITAGWRLHMIELTSKLIPTPQLDAWRIFFQGVFPKWIMDAINAGVLASDLSLNPGFTVVDIMTLKDFEYFATKNMISLNLKTLPAEFYATAPSITPLPVTLPTLHPKQLEHARKLYTGDEADFMLNVNKLLALYTGLGGESNFFSIPPPVKLDGFELFANPFNFNGLPGEYCSGFQLEQDYFSSQGSIFNYQLQSGKTYLANPYFGETVILKMAKYLIAELQRLSELKDGCITMVVLTLPDWNNFEGCEYILAHPEFIKYKTSLDKSYPYFNPFTQSYASVCKSNFYVLSTLESPDTSDGWRQVQRVHPAVQLGSLLIMNWKKEIKPNKVQKRHGFGTVR